MTYLHSAKKLQPNEIIRHIERSAAQTPFEEIKCPEIRTGLREHIILRTSWVYGNHGHNFVKTMLRLGKAREMLRVVDDQVGCPTCAADIAETILRLASIYREGNSISWGTHHYCGKGITTWYGFAKTIFEIAKNFESFAIEEIGPITPEEYPLPAKRPANSVLDCTCISKSSAYFQNRGRIVYSQ